jgi:hypothetical protein
MVDKEDVELLQWCGPSFENLRWWARSLDEVDSIDRPIVGSANMSSSGEMGLRTRLRTPWENRTTPTD